MTPRETLALTRFVKACCPQQEIDEYTPEAWHELLGDLSLAQCRVAVRTVARRQPFVAPSEIITEVARGINASKPHTEACRAGDHADCRFRWCSCACHPIPHLELAQ
jgi:hypothetical protein